VDGFMLSPAYSYAAVQTQEIFMSREEIREKFRQATELLGKYNLMVSNIYLEYLRGERELPCTVWGSPTYNPRGWKSPCYAMTDGHYPTFAEFIEKTPWENYAPGRDPRCADCMMHVGFELSAVLGANRKLGDNWKMLKWQLSGKMGGARGRIKPANGNGQARGNGHGNGSGNGQGNGHGERTNGPGAELTAPPADLVAKDGSLRVL
jgi:hypothetical protein